MTLVLVEGASDERAVVTLAERLGRDLAGVDVVAMHGVTNLGRHLAAADPRRRTLGLYDVGAATYVTRVLARTGTDPAGFHGCDADLEDELIRAVGTDGVLRVIEAEGGLASFATLQKQPAHRARPVDAQLHRFLSSHSGHKLRYAGLLVRALDLDRVPAPLGGLITAL
ncbi:ATP-dependent endonuclease [Nocardioides lijunqiniae]|uniref:ATP-dependent endonuclease n=1 Tax=Nocardioides lijunqiniae TaxID=2760832 RepID=UPI00187787AC|nr:ATP-dependent endonuclease [Nocardioides lijunqiniae]